MALNTDFQHKMLRMLQVKHRKLIHLTKYEIQKHDSESVVSNETGQRKLPSITKPVK